MGTIYDNISDQELPVLLRTCYEENGCDMEMAAKDIECFDVLLGLQKNRMLLVNNRTPSGRMRKDRNYMQVVEAAICKTYGIS